jgi:hypothetical protein
MDKLQYEQKRNSKVERFNNLSQKATAQSEQAYNTANRISSFIPFGQPILNA